MMPNNVNHGFHNERIYDVEDRESLIIQYGKDEDSDGECEVNSKSNRNGSGFEDFKRIGMVEIEEGTHDYGILSAAFLKAAGNYAKDTKILAIHKNGVVDPLMKARREAFKIFEQAMAEKCGGDANGWFGWYSGTEEEICRIFSYGFSSCSETANGESYGVGINLYCGKFPFNSFSSVKPLVNDRNGVSHILLCRVIMGKMEPIPVGSNQMQPSSMEFDSGVDDLRVPRRLTVWSAFMNSHIFPICVISFKPPSINGRNQVSMTPSSPWMSFPKLMGILSKRLDPSKMASISKSYEDFKNNKITRQKMVQRLRQISGDGLLIEIIKSCKYKFLGCRQSKPFQPKKLGIRTP